MGIGLGLQGYGPEREEKLVLRMALDHRQFEEHRGDLEKWIAALPRVLTRDGTLTIEQSIHIGYFGGIVQRIQAIRELCKDPAIVVSVKHSELLHGECLIEQMLVEFRELEALVKARDGRSPIGSVD